MKPLQRVVLVGSGNLAEAVAQALSQSGVELVQLFARNPERGQRVAALAGCEWCGDLAQMAEAESYLLADSDRAVGEVASSLRIPSGAVVAHTAGSVALEALPAKFANRAVFYPMQTFTVGRRVDFSTVPIFLECEREALRAPLEALARKLSRKVVWASSEERRRIHLAAVFVCNFANHLFALGEQLSEQAGVDFEVLKPLIAETVAKALEAPSPRSVQTGPALRDDQQTMERHLALLADEPRLQTLYKLISQSIWETSKRI